MRQSNLLTLACTLALAGFAFTGSSAQAQNIAHTESAVDSALEAGFSSALSEVLGLYELEVQSASRAWYADYTAAAVAHAAVERPDVTDRLAAALERRGLDLADLNAYARSNPEFVAAENRRAEARIQAARPAAFAVLGRIAPAVEGAEVVDHVAEYASTLAQPTPMARAVRVAKER